jgi:hypothetical protein
MASLNLYRYFALTRRVPSARFRSPFAFKLAVAVKPILFPAFKRLRKFLLRRVAR